MYENEYMYAIERNDKFLAHYGVRGMKWGVRKAIASGNSARLGRQYAKAQRKLAKLEKRASRSSKYGRRAALLGAGAAAAGGLAVAGTGGVAKGMRNLIRPASRATKDIGYALTKVPGRNKVSQALHRTGVAMYKSNNKVGEALTRSATAVDKWGNSTSISKAAGRAVGNVHLPTGASRVLTKTTGNNMPGLGEKLKKSGITNNTFARVGAGAIGAGLAVGAARNAYKAATAKKKAANFRSEMNKAFAGTKYSNGGNRQGKKRRRK